MVLQGQVRGQIFAARVSVDFLQASHWERTVLCRVAPLPNQRRDVIVTAAVVALVTAVQGHSPELRQVDFNHVTSRARLADSL